MQYIYFKESEKNQLGDINKWLETPSLVFCYKFYLIKAKFLVGENK
jgi:hypothetical protein